MYFSPNLNDNLLEREKIMEEKLGEKINKNFGIIFQNARLNKKLTQEQVAELLSKSTKTISQIETAKDGTSKKTDIDFMNLLDITPNELYKDFITNENLKNKIFVSEKISSLSPEKIDAILKIIEVIKDI